MGICRIDGKIRGAVEELESCIKKYGEVPTLKTLKPLLSLAEEYLKIEGWPEERGYLEKLENDNPYLTEDWNAGFNEALRLCKLAAMQEKTGMKENSIDLKDAELAGKLEGLGNVIENWFIALEKKQGLDQAKEIDEKGLWGADCKSVTFKEIKTGLTTIIQELILVKKEG